MVRQLLHVVVYLDYLEYRRLEYLGRHLGFQEYLGRLEYQEYLGRLEYQEWLGRLGRRK